jgi:competence protein ComEC
MIRIFLIIILIPSALNSSSHSYFIVWNIGQGSWASLIKSHECWHFDVGGEIFPTAVKTLCQQKNNFLFLSHDDWDHLSNAREILKWEKVCLFEQPRKTFSKSKRNLLNRFQKCPQQTGVQEISWNVKGKTPNDLSRVFYLKNPGILLPGDSSRSQEKFWAPLILPLKIKWWLLGHHGSLTSSSKSLLKNIGKPMAVASAKWARYRHPHPMVEARLRQQGIPLMRTEDWGHIWIALD